eukprot:gene9599-24478_t
MNVYTHYPGATLPDGTAAVGSVARLLKEAAAVEDDWRAAAVFDGWRRVALAHDLRRKRADWTPDERCKESALVPFMLVNTASGRAFRVLLHPALRVGDVATAFAESVAKGIGLQDGARLRCEHKRLYVDPDCTVADVVAAGSRSFPGDAFKLRITFADDTRTDVDSQLDMSVHDDVQRFFDVDP